MNIRFIIAKILYKLVPAAIKDSSIDKTSKILSRSDVQDCIVGKYSYVGYNCKITNAEIGSFCSIADCVHIGGAGHPIEWVSTSPVFCNGKNVLKKNFARHEFISSKKTIVGSDVWIGSGANIKAGCTVGNGAIIGSESMVVNDIGPYEIWAGNPAVFIRKRFDDEIISKLIESKWWEKEDVLKYSSEHVREPLDFLEYYLAKGEV